MGKKNLPGYKFSFLFAQLKVFKGYTFITALQKDKSNPGKANLIFQWISLSNATLLAIAFFACGIHKLNYIKNYFV